MLELTDCEPFAIGGRRACYVHPHDQNRCVKVILPDKMPDQLRRSNGWWKRLHREAYYDENLQDLKIYRYLSKRYGAAIHEHLPEVFGLVETDLGVALDVELIRDPDGRISLSGKEYILSHGISNPSLDALHELESFMLRYLVQFRDPFPHNIAVQVRDNNTLRLVIIDGLARKSWIPLQMLPRAIATQRIRKKIRRLRTGLERTEHDRKTGIIPKSKGLLRYR